MTNKVVCIVGNHEEIEDMYKNDREIKVKTSTTQGENL